MRKIAKYLLGMLISVFGMATAVQAADFSVTETNAVLYTTEQAVLYADADLSTAVVLSAENLPDNVPVSVTGITNNGFFRVDIGGQYYIYANGLKDNAQPQLKSQSQGAFNEADVYNKIMAMKAQYPEGMHWTNDDYYEWNAGIFSGGFGCAGYAFILSDVAFGSDTPAYIHEDYNNIRVGDILRINGDSHSVVVLQVKPDSVVVTEGNFNKSIHWGREISKSRLPGPGNYIISRY